MGRDALVAAEGWGKGLLFWARLGEVWMTLFRAPTMPLVARWFPCRAPIRPVTLAMAGRGRVGIARLDGHPGHADSVHLLLGGTVGCRRRGGERGRATSATMATRQGILKERERIEKAQEREREREKRGQRERGASCTCPTK